MSEYTDRLVQQTEAMLHFRHDETLTETVAPSACMRR